PVACGAGDLAPVAREEDPHVELVPVALDLLEEAPDTAEVLVALVHPAAHGLGQLRIGTVHVDLPPAGHPEELLLVPLARRMSPGLDRAVGERRGPIGDHPRLVVAQEVAEPLALGTGAERMVEGEEQGLRALERCAAGLAAELLAVTTDLRRLTLAEDLHH